MRGDGPDASSHRWRQRNAGCDGAFRGSDDEFHVGEEFVGAEGRHPVFQQMADAQLHLVIQIKRIWTITAVVVVIWSLSRLSLLLWLLLLLLLILWLVLRLRLLLLLLLLLNIELRLFTLIMRLLGVI